MTQFIKNHCKPFDNFIERRPADFSQIHLLSPRVPNQIIFRKDLKFGYSTSLELNIFTPNPLAQVLVPVAEGGRFIQQVYPYDGITTIARINTISGIVDE